MQASADRKGARRICSERGFPRTKSFSFAAMITWSSRPILATPTHIVSCVYTACLHVGLDISAQAGFLSPSTPAPSAGIACETPCRKSEQRAEWKRAEQAGPLAGQSTHSSCARTRILALLYNLEELLRSLTDGHVPRQLVVLLPSARAHPPRHTSAEVLQACPCPAHAEWQRTCRAPRRTAPSRGCPADTACAGQPCDSPRCGRKSCRAAMSLGSERRVTERN